MNPFDKILKSNNQPASSTKKVGLYDDILSDIGNSKPKTSTFSTIKSAGKEIVKGLVKLPLRAATNIDQALNGTNREIYSEGLRGGGGQKILDVGRITPIGTQTFDTGGISKKNLNLKNVAKDALDIGGSAVEAASYLPFAGAIKGGYTAGKALVTGGKEAAKQSLKGMAFEGAVGGATQSLGQQTQQYAQDGTPISVGDVGKSAVGGAVAAPVLGGIFRGLGKIFNRGEKPAALVVADEIIPEAPKLSKEERYANYLKSQGYEGYKKDIPDIKMGSKPKPAIPTIEYGKTSPKVGTSEKTPQPKTSVPSQNIINSPEDVDRVLSSIIKDGKKAPELAEQAVKEAPTTPKNIDPVNVAKATKIVEDMPDSNIMTPFERQRNVEQVASIMQRPQEEIFDIVKGNKELPDNIPIDAYLSVAKNIADETTDPTLQTKLSLELLPYRKEISSKSGQKLQANAIAKKNNIVDILGEIEDEKFKKLSKDAQLRYSKELEDAIQTVQKEFEAIKNLAGTRQQIIDALSKLIC